MWHCKVNVTFISYFVIIVIYFYCTVTLQEKVIQKQPAWTALSNICLSLLSEIEAHLMELKRQFMNLDTCEMNTSCFFKFFEFWIFYLKLIYFFSNHRQFRNRNLSRSKKKTESSRILFHVNRPVRQSEFEIFFF